MGIAAQLQRAALSSLIPSHGRASECWQLKGGEACTHDSVLPLSLIRVHMDSGKAAAPWLTEADLQVDITWARVDPEADYHSCLHARHA